MSYDHLHTKEYFKKRSWSYFEKGDFIIPRMHYVGISERSVGKDNYHDYLIVGVYEIIKVDMKLLKYDVINKLPDSYRDKFILPRFKSVHFKQHNGHNGWELAPVKLKTLYQMELI